MAGDVHARSPHAGRAADGVGTPDRPAGCIAPGIESILGLRRRGERFVIDPCIPSSWPEYRMVWRFLDSHLPHLRDAMAAVTDRYLTVQQDILETFIDRGQLRQLAEPTCFPSGKRIHGLTLDHPRQLAVMHALVRFAHIAGGDTFTTTDLHPAAAAALDATTDQYRLASLRDDLSKLRAKRLVEKVEHSRRYRLLPQGYRICILFLKLFERVYAPLTAGLLRPIAADAALAEEKRHRLDRLYQCIVTDLDDLLRAVGLRSAA